MSAPSLIIDASLAPYNSDIYYVVEADAIWRTGNLTEAGAATWVQIYDANTQFTDGTWVSFTRIICSTWPLDLGIVYALGVAQKYGQSGSGYTVYCLRSTNAGVSWTCTEVASFEKIESDYYLVGTCSEVGGPYSDGTEYDHVFEQLSSTKFYLKVTKAKAYSWGFTYYIPLTGWICGSPWDPNYPTKMKARITWLHQDDIGLSKPTLQWGPTSWETPTSLGGGVYEYDPINTGIFSYNNVRYPLEFTSIGQYTEMIFEVIEVEGDTVYSDEVWPTAFDVAPSSVNWLYVGLPTAIMHSENGGGSWYSFYGGGANDICVDPQLAGAIYCWSVDGNLNLLIKSGLIAPGVLTSEGLMTETGRDYANPLRIGRDPSSGRLLAIPDGTTLKMRNLGSTIDLKTGLLEGRGLHVYAGYKMIMVDSANIWISDDLSAVTPTITAKKGGWSAYGDGINAHRMTAT